ncbi:MAG: hypothetical protein ACE5QV_02420, partial [Fidelibacterota bacterium]
MSVIRRYIYTVSVIWTIFTLFSISLVAGDNDKSGKSEAGERKNPYISTASGSVGAVVIDGKIYNQVSLRPEIPVGKFGVALDLVLYIDDRGHIRKEDWDELGDIIDKIFYVRYGKPEEPIFVRVGALADVSLGYGIIVDRYSNTVEYPAVKRIGANFSYQ